MHLIKYGNKQTHDPEGETIVPADPETVYVAFVCDYCRAMFLNPMYDFVRFVDAPPLETGCDICALLDTLSEEDEKPRPRGFALERGDRQLRLM